MLDPVDVLYDLDKLPFPFASECADEIIFSHVLEHFAFSDLVQLLEEARRLLKPGACMTISVPHAGSIAAFTDPTHKTFFTFGTFYYFTQQYRFSYYKNSVTGWETEKIWASTNIFNTQLQRERGWQTWLNQFCSRIMNFFLRHSKDLTLPDLLAKTLPIWLINIHVSMRKITIGEI